MQEKQHDLHVHAWCSCLCIRTHTQSVQSWIDTQASQLCIATQAIQQTTQTTQEKLNASLIMHVAVVYAHMIACRDLHNQFDHVLIRKPHKCTLPHKLYSFESLQLIDSDICGIPRLTQAMADDWPQKQVCSVGALEF